MVSLLSSAPPLPRLHTSACEHENCGSKLTSRAALRSTGPWPPLSRPSSSEQPRAELDPGDWNVPCAKRYAARWNAWNASIVDHERLWKIGWSAVSRRDKKSVGALPALTTGEADGGEVARARSCSSEADSILELVAVSGCSGGCRGLQGRRQRTHHAIFTNNRAIYRYVEGT